MEPPCHEEEGRAEGGADEGDAEEVAPRHEEEGSAEGGAGEAGGERLEEDDEEAWRSDRGWRPDSYNAVRGVAPWRPGPF